MGNRYIISVLCVCGNWDNDVCYAPICGWATHKCSKCGHVIDLEEYTGISYEEASNIDTIQSIADAYKRSPK